MPSNLSLQSVCDYVLTNVRGAPIQDVLGVQNEPALSICNDVYQETLQRPLTWRFNKANTANTGLGVLYFTSQQYVQDYPTTNATASTSTGVVHIETVAGSPNPGAVCDGINATITTSNAWVHNFSAGQSVTLLNAGQWSGGVFTPTPALNVTSTISSVPSPTTFIMPNTTPAGSYGAPGVNDIGWIERCVLEDFANTATVKPRHSIEVTMNLELESIVQPPFKISYQYTLADANTATGQTTPSVTAVFRLWPVPSSQVWGIMIDYQLKPQTFSTLAQTWGVWPDELIFVIRQGVRAFALDFVEDPRAISEYQIFQSKLNQVREIRDQERPSQTMFPDRPILLGG